jgi:outer membrane murein-binding lipoprotein Lpp
MLARISRNGRGRAVVLGSLWQAGTVSNLTVDQLVTGWLSLRDVADRLGVSPNKVRQMVRDHQLAALRHPEAREPQVPAEMLDGASLVKGLAGTLTLLADAGYDEQESVRWLFTADDSLPGRPIDALRESRGTEVRRRAQALAF